MLFGRFAAYHDDARYAKKNIEYTKNVSVSLNVGIKNGQNKSPLKKSDLGYV